MVAWITVNLDDFKYTRGNPTEYRSSPPVCRTFCPRCGTTLTYLHKDSGGTIDVTLSTLDNPGVIAPDEHIWMDDAPVWDRPEDSLPKYRTSHSAGLTYSPSDHP